MKKIYRFYAEENQIFNSSFFIKKLGIFIIHIEDINKEEEKDQKCIMPNAEI